ncbi:MAG: DUF5131 family protein [Myxococcota bacterium]
MADTDIEWATKVWNFVRGCRRVSAGCGGPCGEGGCYAEREAYRFSAPGLPYHGLVTLGTHGPRWTGKGSFIVEKLWDPFKWQLRPDGSRHRVFVNSMSDLFFEAFSNEQIAAGFGVMATCPRHNFIVLTKRASRARDWYRWLQERPLALSEGEARVCVEEAYALERGTDRMLNAKPQPWPLPNVWIGPSAENQETYNQRVPLMVHAVPAAVHCASLEPLLGPIDLRATGRLHLDWVIVGGESGYRARPCALEWIESIVEQCDAERIPVFVKQLGANATLRGKPFRQVNRKGADMAEWPAYLRCRDFPSEAT